MTKCEYFYINAAILILMKPEETHTIVVPVLVPSLGEWGGLHQEEHLVLNLFFRPVTNFSRHSFLLMYS